MLDGKHKNFVIFSSFFILIFTVLVYNFAPIYMVIVPIALYGGFVCPIVVITFEEFINLLDPRYLLTGSVTLRMTGSAFAGIMTSLFTRYLDDNQTPDSGSIVGCVLSVLYSIMAVVTISGAFTYQNRKIFLEEKAKGDAEKQSYASDANAAFSER